MTVVATDPLDGFMVIPGVVTVNVDEPELLLPSFAKTVFAPAVEEGTVIEHAKVPVLSVVSGDGEVAIPAPLKVKVIGEGQQILFRIQ